MFKKKWSDMIKEIMKTSSVNTEDSKGQIQ